MEELADTGSMICPAVGGVVNTAGARQPVNSAVGVVVEDELAALPHAVRTPAAIRPTAPQRLNRTAMWFLMVCFRPPPRASTDTTDVARTRWDSSAPLLGRAVHAASLRSVLLAGCLTWLGQ